MDAGNDKTKRSHFELRLLLLALVAVGLNLWVTHHFELGRAFFGLANGVLAALSLFAAFLEKAQKDESVSRLGRILRVLTSDQALAILIVGFLIVGCSFTKITIIPDGSKSIVGKAAEITRNDRFAAPSSETFVDEKSPVSMVLLTSPFGTPCSLRLDGFVRVPFHVFPWVGKTIRVATDMQVIPSLLFRVPQDRWGSLNEGRIEVRRGEELVLAAPTAEHRGAVRAGQSRAVPLEVLENWRLELMVEGFKESELNPALVNWRNAVVTNTSVSISPGDVLSADYYVGANPIAAARGEWRVNTESFQDLPLVSTTGN